jgi:polyphenol oxidase
MQADTFDAITPDFGVPGVRALVTCRNRGGPGVSSPPFDRFNLGNRYAADGDDPENVERNRELLARLAGLPSPPHWLRQVHGTHVVRFDKPAFHAVDGGGDVIQSAPSQADAAVTATPGVVLAVLTADCLPVLLAGADGRAIGVAHAGWRGLAAGVLERTIEAMHVPPATLQAWLGPAAGPDAYEVGDEVRTAFVDADPAAAAAFRQTRPGHWLCDLYALARQRLVSCGVRRVTGGEHCTISDAARFFSHRRDGRSGRMATVAWIAG